MLDGEDLRRLPIEHRKRKLAKQVRGPYPGITLNEHYDGDGEIVFKHTCKLGCEGHRIETAWLALPFRPITALGEGQEPESASGQA